LDRAAENLACREPHAELRFHNRHLIAKIFRATSQAFGDY
jgi:hypothetical protein